MKEYFLAIPRTMYGTGTSGVELFIPVDAAGQLHHDEQGQDAADGDRETGVPLKKKGVRKQNQINELRKPCFQKSEPYTQYKPDI